MNTHSRSPLTSEAQHAQGVKELKDLKETGNERPTKRARHLWYPTLPLLSRIGMRLQFGVFGWLTCGTFDRFVAACYSDETYRLEKDPLA